MNVFEQSKIVGFKIISAEETQQEPQNGFSSENYPCENSQNTSYVIQFISDGFCDYYFSGKNIISAQKSDIVFYPKRKLVKARIKSNYQSYVIKFEAQNGFIDSPVIFSPKNSKENLLLFKDAAHLFNQKKSGYMLMIKSVFLKILSEINCKNEKANYHFSKNNKIAYLTKHIEENLINYQLSVEKIAKEMNVSSTHLRKIIIEETGMSPLKYIKSIKMDYAKKLLIEKDIPIAQITLECGFLDTSYFCKEFKKITGVSPLTFRKINCKK